MDIFKKVKLLKKIYPTTEIDIEMNYFINFLILQIYSVIRCLQSYLEELHYHILYTIQMSEHMDEIDFKNVESKWVIILQKNKSYIWKNHYLNWLFENYLNYNKSKEHPGKELLNHPSEKKRCPNILRCLKCSKYLSLLKFMILLEFIPMRSLYL